MPDSFFNLPEDEWERAKYLSALCGFPCLQFLPKPSGDAIATVPLALAEGHEIFPLSVRHESTTKAVSIAMAHADPTLIDNLSFELNLGIEPIFAPRKEILRAIAIYYRHDH